VFNAVTFAPRVAINAAMRTSPGKVHAVLRAEYAFYFFEVHGWLLYFTIFL
jgi:hypothetical protein